jgi:CTP synthase
MALRSLNFRHVSLVPTINTEFKTKPTQQAIRDVRSAGLSPDLIACRCDTPLDKPSVEKIALYCQVEPKQVIAVHNVDSTYHVPMFLEQQRLKELLGKILRLDAVTIPPQLQARGAAIWSDWKALTGTKHYDEVTIVMVQKYAQQDAFMSVGKVLEHACMRCRLKLNLVWVDASHLEADTLETSPAVYHKA